MNRTSLKALLDAEDVRDDLYGLYGHPGDETLCLERLADGWHVYYSERGLRTGERTYSTEHEACEFMASRLLADPSTRRER